MRKVTASSSSSSLHTSHVCSSALDRNQSHVHEHVIYSQNVCRIWSHSEPDDGDQVRLTEIGFKSGLQLITVIIDRSFCNFYSWISSVRVLPGSQSDLQPLSRSTEAGLSGSAASLTSESLTCSSSSGSLKDVRTFKTNPKTWSQRTCSDQHQHQILLTEELEQDNTTQSISWLLKLIN